MTIKKVLSCSLVLLALSIPATAQRRSVPVQESDRPGIDVDSYSIEITLMPAEHMLRGIVDMKLRQLERSSYLTFDLDNRLRVDTVLIDGTEARFRQYDLDSTIEVSTANSQLADVTTLRFEYEGFLDPPGGKRAPALASISENGAFLLYDSKWFPTNELYKDKAAVSLVVHVPDDWTVVSDLPKGGNGFSGPTPSYWGLVAAGKYSSSTIKTDRAEVTVDTLNAKSEDVTPIVEMAGSVLDFYTETFGPSVRNSFHIIEAPDANWSSRSGVGALLLSGGQFRADFDKQALTIALAHEWFPLKFAVEDPARDAWLADGFATWASLLYAEKKLPPADYQEQVDKALVKALGNEDRITTAEAGRLEHESPEYKSLVEYKGAYILRMLRWVMGDEEFDVFLARFVEKFQNTPVSTAAVQSLASEVHGEDLDYFFQQWLTDSGVPEMTAEWQILRIRDGYRIQGEIRQDLDLFRMPVELEIETDGEPDYQRIEVARQASEFTVVTERKPKAINIDPRKKILRLSPDIRVAVSINRGEELMNEDRFNEAMDQFQDALDMDPASSLASFRMGEAMFELGNLTPAAQNFRNVITGDLKPKWVEVWSYINLGKIYDSRGDHERAIPEYQKAISTGDDAYGAQAEAQRLIEQPFKPGSNR